MTRFPTDATAASSTPIPRLSSGTGLMNRLIAPTMIAAAATTISVPSTAAERYSALPWPKSWLWSAGLADSRMAHSATPAASRLTVDSRASDQRPTELVRIAATAFSTTVTTAVASDSHRKRSR